MAEILRRGIIDASFQFFASNEAEDLFFWDTTLRHAASCPRRTYTLDVYTFTEENSYNFGPVPSR